MKKVKFEDLDKSKIYTVKRVWDNRHPWSDWITIEHRERGWFSVNEYHQGHEEVPSLPFFDNDTWRIEEYYEIRDNPHYKPEPEEKKLYAFKYCEDVEVRFCVAEEHPWNGGLERAPEYDITYPVKD